MPSTLLEENDLFFRQLITAAVSGFAANPAYVNISEFVMASHAVDMAFAAWDEYKERYPTAVAEENELLKPAEENKEDYELVS